jgi:hypothetical protein
MAIGRDHRHAIGPGARPHGVIRLRAIKVLRRATLLAVGTRKPIAGPDIPLRG